MVKVQAMSDSEKEIMRVIWKAGGSLSNQELLDQLEDLNKGWKRTTVRTFITRLMEKGYLGARKEGRLSIYDSRISEEEYLAGQAQSFIDDMFGGSVRGLLSTLVGQD